MLSSTMLLCITLLPSTVMAFSSLTKPTPIVPRQFHQRQRHSVSSSSSSALHATLRFYGDSFTNVRVTIPKEATSPSRTLPEFLLCAECSDVVLLGSDNTFQRTDKLWDAKQNPVGWFGLEVVPVFVNKITRDEKKNRVATSITEARTDILKGGSGTRGRVIQEVMKQSTFEGQNILSWVEFRDTNIGEGVDDRVWTLSGELSLTLIITMPPFLPIPPGFNSIGSRIVSVTCKKRAEESLLAVKEAYEKWACLPYKKGSDGNEELLAREKTINP